MDILTIKQLKEEGYRAIKIGEKSYAIADPEGNIISKFSQETEWHAWYNIPRTEIEDYAKDGYELDYSWTSDESVAIIDRHEKEKIYKHCCEYGGYGADSIALTPEDIKALQEGKCIVWGQGEYSSIIYYHEEDND